MSFYEVRIDNCSYSRTELSSQVFMDLLGQVLQLAKGKRLYNWVMSNTQIQTQPRTFTNLWSTRTNVDSHTLTPTCRFRFMLQMKGWEVCEMLSFHTGKLDATCSASSHPLLTPKSPLPSWTDLYITTSHCWLILTASLWAAQPGGPQ